MFLGHFAAALAAKKLTPYTSLGTLIVAGEFADLVWPTLLLRGTEQVRIVSDAPPLLRLEFISYPWSHSLLMLGVWAGLAAALYAFFRRYRRGTIVVAALVVSHWVLDAASHRPDMPVVPWGGPLVGLGLWYSQTATYRRRRSAPRGRNVALCATDRAGGQDRTLRVRRVHRTFIAIVYVGSLLGPPPPSVSRAGVVGPGLMAVRDLGLLARSAPGRDSPMVGAHARTPHRRGRRCRPGRATCTDTGAVRRADYRRTPGRRHGRAVGAGRLAIAGDRIAAIGDLGGRTGNTRVDATNLVVAPGFIDMLGQSEFNVLVDGRAASKIMMGVTTEITGEGGSIAPVNARMIAQDKAQWDHYGLDAGLPDAGRVLHAARDALEAGDQSWQLRRRRRRARLRDRPRERARQRGTSWTR